MHFGGRSCGWSLSIPILASINLLNLKAIHQYFSWDGGGNRQGVRHVRGSMREWPRYDKTKGGEIEQNRMKIYGKIPAIIYRRTIRHNTPPYATITTTIAGKRFSAYQRHQLSLRLGVWRVLVRQLHWRCQLQRDTHRYTHTYGNRADSDAGEVAAQGWQWRSVGGRTFWITSECPQTAPSGCRAGTW